MSDIDWAEYPQRQCRQPVTDDGLIDHWCALADLHPGPCCPRTLTAAIERRKKWEADNPGWESMKPDDDPFADFTEKLKDPHERPQEQ